MTTTANPPRSAFGWALRQPTFWAALALTVGALVILSAPANPSGVAQQVGIGLVFSGVVLFIVAAVERLTMVLAPAVVPIVLGALLIIDADNYTPLVMLVVAGLSAVLGVWIGATMMKAGNSTPISIMVGLVMTATGALFVAYPVQLLPLGFGTILTVLAAITGFGLAAAYTTTGPAGDVSITEAWRAAGGWVQEQLHDNSAATDEVVDNLYFEGDERRSRLNQFYVLMAFASAIASFGVLADSTAVVIGAMLVAPLLIPLMGMSLALVSGNGSRLADNLQIVFFAVCIPIGMGAVLAAIAGQGVDPSVNTQIVSRGTPTLLDLGVAIAAGGAGAFGNSGKKLANSSLPGVAVAIALVPPLAVVGVAAQLGDWSASIGALLLFVTNATAILVMGGITFVFTGVARLGSNVRGSLGPWILGLVSVAGIVLWGLAANSTAINSNGARTSIARGLAQEWADANRYELSTVALDGQSVQVVVNGEQEVDNDKAKELADNLRETLETENLDLRVNLQSRSIVELVTTTTTGGG